MASLQDGCTSELSDEIVNLGRSYVRTGLELWRSSFRVWAYAVKGAAEEACGADGFARGPRWWLRAFGRGAETYCVEMAAALPRTADELIREADVAWLAAVHLQIQERANMPSMVYPASRRLVQLYIIDPDSRVPDNVSKVWDSGAPRLTSLTDEELWFEEAVNSGAAIQAALQRFNATRVTLPDPTAQPPGTLQPVEFRDLKRSVVTTARL